MIFGKGQLLILIFLFPFGVLFAQRTISGKVTDAVGTPLPGASVILQGTTTGSMTDLDGNFSIQVPEDNGTLQFLYTGYKSQNVQIGASNIINVSMKEDFLLFSRSIIGNLVLILLYGLFLYFGIKQFIKNTGHQELPLFWLVASLFSYYVLVQLISIPVSFRISLVVFWLLAIGSGYYIMQNEKIQTDRSGRNIIRFGMLIFTVYTLIRIIMILL